MTLAGEHGDGRGRPDCRWLVTAEFRVTSNVVRQPDTWPTRLSRSRGVVRGLASGIQPEGFGVIVIEQDTGELALSWAEWS
jgi:hypothetical protein